MMQLFRAFTDALSLPALSKADFLRYLLLLVEGGTWSDMDTVPLMPLDKWGEGAVPLFSPRRATRGSRFVGSSEDLERLEKGPIRLVVGLETDPTEWWVSPGALIELLQLKVVSEPYAGQLSRQLQLLTCPSCLTAGASQSTPMRAVDVARCAFAPSPARRDA